MVGWGWESDPASVRGESNTSGNGGMKTIDAASGDDK
jgi:hypothetical protein